MKGAEARPRAGREDLRAKVMEVGEALGLRAEAEYRLGDHSYDVALFSPDKLFPAAVAKISVGGDPSKDLAGLEYAFSRHKLIPIYVAGSEDDARRAESEIQSSFREIKDKIILLRAGELEDLRRVLRSEAAKKALRALLCSLQLSARHDSMHPTTG